MNGKRTDLHSSAEAERRVTCHQLIGFIKHVNVRNYRDFRRVRLLVFS